jgi:hypothetical protein
MVGRVLASGTEVFMFNTWTKQAIKVGKERSEVTEVEWCGVEWRTQFCSRSGAC